ncbi:MAG: hypothetical protein CENE_03768 [Candidatus Celerinatantimonas neptuna]|nr:MAG: hypothetical protein CENE_03768 [Candidatus Celerinatantimonas neptuna]
MSFHLNRSSTGHFIKNVKSLSNGLQGIPLNVLLNDHFIQRCSFCRDVSEFFSGYEFKVDSADMLDEFPKQQIDDFIAQHSDYLSWDEMRNQAVKEYILLHLARGNEPS